MLKFRISIFFLLSYFFIQAQSVGYLGRKFSIGYAAGLSPALSNPNYSQNMMLNPTQGNNSGNPNYLPQQSLLSLNYSHNIIAECVVKRHLSLFVSGTFYNTTAYSHGKQCAYQYTDPNSYNGVTTEYSTPVGLINVSGQSYSLGLMIFTRRYIAPFGRYIGIQLAYMKYNATYDPGSFYIEQLYNYSNGTSGYAPNTGVSFGPTTQSFSKMDFLFSLGKQRIFFDRLVFNYGAKVSLFSAFSAAVNFSEIDSDLGFSSPLTNNNFIENMATKRVRNFNLFTFYMSVSFLLF